MSEPMTKERLAEIGARANAATLGPWEANDYGPSVRAANGATIASGGDDPCDATEADCVFIAHAREDVPALAAAVRQRDERIAELETALRRALDAHRYHDKDSVLPPTCGVCTGAWPCDNPTCPVGAGFLALDGKDGER